MKDGCIGVASSIMDDICVQCAIFTLENNQIRSMRTYSNDDSNVENNQEVENAYDEMLSQIDRTRSFKETDFHLNIRGMHSTGDNRKKLANC